MKLFGQFGDSSTRPVRAGKIASKFSDIATTQRPVNSGVSPFSNPGRSPTSSVLTVPGHRVTQQTLCFFSSCAMSLPSRSSAAFPTPYATSLANHAYSSPPKLEMLTISPSFRGTINRDARIGADVRSKAHVVRGVPYAEIFLPETLRRGIHDRVDGSVRIVDQDVQPTSVLLGYEVKDALCRRVVGMVANDGDAAPPSRQGRFVDHPPPSSPYHGRFLRWPTWSAQ